MDKKLILASASPRRREILDTAGYSYEVIPSNADEFKDGYAPAELVRLNALAKAREVCSRVDANCVVIGADTVVCLGDDILGKPKDEKEAFDMLKSLSGKAHYVVTGFAVVGKTGEKSGACFTEVKFKNLTDEEINAYISTQEPMDKAGSYGVQERACLFVESFKGDYFNIIGLPITQIYPILKEYGIVPDWQKMFGEKTQIC